MRIVRASARCAFAALFAVLTLAAPPAGAADADAITLAPAHLHMPLFPDHDPPAVPAPAVQHAITDHPLALLFTVRSPSDAALRFGLRIEGSDAPIGLTLYRALDVRVEGNTNGACSCAAGELPQSTRDGFGCVPAERAIESARPAFCPTGAERGQADTRLVRRASFWIKDPLRPIDAAAAHAVAGGRTEAFLAEIALPSSLPRGDARLVVQAVAADGRRAGFVQRLHLHRTRVTEFPALDVSFWLSPDPRELVARPSGVAIDSEWGPAWWSDEHWRVIRQAASLQRRMGVTNVLMPLFVTSPFALNAEPLVATHCVLGAGAGSSAAPRGGGAVERYRFDFSRLRRWIRLFDDLGYRWFEGAHLAARSGELPNHLLCDVYRDDSATEPVTKRHRFLTRSATGKAGADGDARRHYREVFLPQFLAQLAGELERAGITARYLQHVIDENEPSDEARRSYADLVELVRRHLPGVRTMDALNQYDAARYSALIDVPVAHLALLYDDPLGRRNIRPDIAAMRAPRYFYNTALRQGGPNRFLDTPAIESRAYGWIALELGFDGYLHWSTNAYRYPVRVAPEMKRAPDWTPFNHSIGPLPGGRVEPGLAPGSNWILYPDGAGLIPSLRALRLRDGLLDHWLFVRARERCADDACRRVLRDAISGLTGDPRRVSDFALDPERYDRMRTELLQVLER